MEFRFSTRATTAALATASIAFGSLGLTAQTWQTGTYFGGLNAEVVAVIAEGDGDVLAAGTFTQAFGIPCPGVARFANGQWASVGPANPAFQVTSAVVRANGDVVVGDAFGVVRRFNGTSWSQLGGTFNAPVLALAESSTGVLYAGGSFQTGVARLNGASWSSIGSGLANVFTVNELDAQATGGGIVAGGRFDIPGVGTQTIATTDGATWSAFPGANPPTGVVESLEIARNGDIIAAASPAGSTWNISRGDGTTWTTIATMIDNPVFALLELPDLDILAGGSFTTVNGIPAPSIARLTTAGWTSLATSFNGPVNSFDVRTPTRIVVGGDYTMINGTVATRIADRTAITPGTATQIFPTCFGPGGLNRLISLTTPMIGQVHRSRASNLGPNTVGLEVRGLSAPPPVPLNTIFPGALTGCSLNVSPDLTLNTPPIVGGELIIEFLVPPDTVFLGASLFQQVLAFDFTVTPFAVTSTHGLDLNFGRL